MTICVLLNCKINENKPKKCLVSGMGPRIKQFLLNFLPPLIPEENLWG